MIRTAARFRALWTRCGGADAAAVWTELAALYAEPARHYHTLDHIRRCLRDFDTVHTQIEEPDVVELALWMHDVIYLPGARVGDNEAASADWLLARAGGRIASAGSVAECVLATTHREPPPHAAAAWTVDIDLAGLGQDWTCFCRDGARLRAERPDLCDTVCGQGEYCFLAMLLARPAIFHTPFFHAAREAQARANLERRIALLTAAES